MMCRSFSFFIEIITRFFPRHMLHIVSAVCFSCLPAVAFSESFVAELTSGDTLRIGLQEAVLMTLERNPTVSIQRMAPGIARSIADEQRSLFEPELSLSLSQSTSKGQRFLGTRPEPVDLETDRNQYGAQISGLLPTGTRISLDTSMSSTESNLYTDQASGNVGLTITQSLLQGFGLGANLANLRRANIDVEISRAELKGVAEDMTARLERAYWELYLAAEEVKIQETSVELAERLLMESQERVAVGKLPELEMATVRAEVAARNEMLIDARSRREQARLNFLYFLNPPGDNAWALSPILADAPFVPVDSLDGIDVHEQLGFKYRPDLQQARFSLEKGEIDVVRTRNGLLPRLDLFVTLGRSTYANTLSEATPDIQSPFRDINAGLTFSMPVTDGRARAQYARAKRSREMMEQSVNNMERMVQRDIRSAYVEVTRARQQIGATRVSRDLQEKKLEAELEKYRVGKSTNYLVLQVQRDYIASQRDETRSMVNYLNALTNLYLTEGTLLERRGVNTDSVW